VLFVLNAVNSFHFAFAPVIGLVSMPGRYRRHRYFDKGQLATSDTALVLPTNLTNGNVEAQTMVDSQSPDQTELKALLERKETLQARLNKIKADIAAGLSKHAVQRAIELENAEVLDEIARVTAEELQQVEDSINRLNVV
jgi:hypothetical protein